jgi:hypothetical protein
MSLPPCPIVRSFLVLGACLVATASRAEDALRLEERFPAGYVYRVRTRVNLSGMLTPPATKGQPAPKSLDIRGESAIDYDERVLEADKGEVSKTIRQVRRMEFRRTIGDRPQETSLRSGVSRLVVLRRGNTEVPFSPDGPLTWGEIDLVRTDVFTPALRGLLPDRAVISGDRWTASTFAIQELTDMDRIEEGKVECRLEQVTKLEDRRYARVSFTGTVRGNGEDGPGRQTLEGYYYFDLESNHLSYLHLDGRHSLLDADGKEVGYVKGRFVLTRQVTARVADLTDEAIKGVVVEPSADNTQLLYDNPDLGIRFLYPRRWRVVGVRGSQITLDTADGNGLLITVDPPERGVTAAQFLTESRDWLSKQKARLLRTQAPRAVEGAEGLEHFALEAEMGGQKFVMDYYVARQAGGAATLAARLQPAEMNALHQEIDRIARSVTLRKR